MNRLHRMLRGACAVLALCFAHGVAAQEPVTTNRATELRAAADDASPVVEMLSAKTRVEVLARRGRWTQVKVGKNTGFINMYHLRGGSTVTEAQPSTGGFMSGFQRLLAGDSGRSGPKAQSATLGIRGFSKEDVARADFNPAEFEKLKRYQASAADAQRIALQGKLSFRAVPYLAQDAIDARAMQGAKK